MPTITRIAATLALLAAASAAAHAQVATTPASEQATQTVTIVGDIAQPRTGQTAYTVPSNRTFRLTDIIITNYNNVICDVYFYVGGTPTREIRTQPNAMTAINLLSGPTASGGQTVVISTDERLPGDSDCTPTFTLGGYLFQKAK